MLARANSGRPALLPTWCAAFDSHRCGLRCSPNSSPCVPDSLLPAGPRFPTPKAHNSPLPAPLPACSPKGAHPHPETAPHELHPAGPHDELDLLAAAAAADALPTMPTPGGPSRRSGGGGPEGPAVKEEEEEDEGQPGSAQQLLAEGRPMFIRAAPLRVGRLPRSRQLAELVQGEALPGGGSSVLAWVRACPPQSL